MSKGKKRARDDGVRMCDLEGCERPVWVGAGIVHKYCGRSHARDALEREGKELQAPHGCCHACRLPRCSNPVAVEQNGRVHDFCCLLHAEEAVEQGRHPKSNRKLVDAVDKWCSYPDCDKQRFRDIERGFDHDFCGRYHAAKAAEVGLAPVPADRAGKVSRVWKGRPGAPPYTLSVLTREHEKYTSVVSQFESAWKHPGRTPEVRRVLQIRNPNEVFNRYTRFKTSAGDAGEERRFHGTTLASSCSFAMDIKQPPCKLLTAPYVAYAQLRSTSTAAARDQTPAIPRRSPYQLQGCATERAFTSRK